MTDAERARDEWLAVRCQAKEPHAFDHLVRHLERPLFCFASKTLGNPDTALEVLQEVWMRAARGIASLRDPRAVRSWLYRLTYGLAIDRLRRDGRRMEAETEHAAALPDTVAPESFHATEALDIHRALDLLPADQREVLTLFFLEDFPVAEIAAILDCPLGTVKSRLHYAKKALKQLITQGATHA